MRIDYEHIETTPKRVAKKRARQHGKRAGLYGSCVTLFVTGHWKFGFSALLLVTLSYIHQCWYWRPRSEANRELTNLGK